MATKKNEVAVAGQYTQNDIPAMLEKVNQQIAKLTKSEDKVSETKGKAIAGFETLENTSCLSSLIKMASSVKGREKAYKDTIKSLKFEKAPEFKLEGCSATQWLDDIKVRYSEVLHKDRLDKLKAVKKKLEANLSAEAKLAKDLEEVAGIMSDY